MAEPILIPPSPPRDRLPGVPVYDEETGAFVGTVCAGILYVRTRKDGRTLTARVAVARLVHAECLPVR